MSGTQPDRGGRAPAAEPDRSGGYPDGARTMPVPDLFFSRDLAQLDDPVALRLMLYVLWRVHRRKPGLPPAVLGADLAEDASVADMVAACGVAEEDEPEAVRAALRRLVTEGLLLAVANVDGWHFVNDHAGRVARARVQAGELVLPAVPGAAGRAPSRGSAAPRRKSAGETPNIYALYEDAIGLLTPLLAEELQEAAQRYPDTWVADAFREAALNNVRKWSYVRAILERWASEGRTDEEHRRSTRSGRRRDSEGPYSKYIER